jgi:hypothetical protein
LNHSVDSQQSAVNSGWFACEKGPGLPGYFTGDWHFATLSIQAPSAIKRFQHFATLSVQGFKHLAMLDVQEKYHNLNAAKRRLNTERSEVIESHEMGIE